MVNEELEDLVDYKGDKIPSYFLEDKPYSSKPKFTRLQELKRILLTPFKDLLEQYKIRNYRLKKLPDSEKPPHFYKK